MKFNLLILNLLFMSVITAQDHIEIVNHTKYVQVTGVAEMDLSPDEIFIRITLQEEKEGKKRSVEQQEKILLDAVKEQNIPLSNLKLDNIGSQTHWYKRNNHESYKQKTYILEVHNAQDASTIMYKLSELEIYNMYVYKTDHSEIEKFKKEVKIKAVQAAKEKATYLLQAVGKNLGDVIYITEQEAGAYMPQYRNTMMLAAESSNAGYEPNIEVEFRPINLKYQILARFEIK